MDTRKGEMLLLDSSGFERKLPLFATGSGPKCRALPGGNCMLPSVGFHKFRFGVLGLALVFLLGLGAFPTQATAPPPRQSRPTASCKTCFTVRLCRVRRTARCWYSCTGYRVVTPTGWSPPTVRPPLLRAGRRALVSERETTCTTTPTKPDSARPS